jgi:TRAP-type C4-dicarboxylate transport system substrate-binding protein
MKFFQRILIVLLTLLLGGTGVVRPAAAQQHYTLRVASFGAAKAVQVTSFVPLFTKLVEERSHGQITVQSFPAGSLLKEHAVPSGIESDVADISLTVLGTWISVVPTIGIVTTAFFSPPGPKFESLMGPGTHLFNELDKAMQARGVKLLAALDNGGPVVASNAPMTSPSDFKGKTIRVYDKPTGEIIRQLGGAPSTITVSDVYPALQRGTVSAALGGLEGAYGLREYEVAKYLLDTNGLFGLDVNGYVMNLHALTSLPANLQKVVLDSAYEAGKVTNAAMIKSHQEELKKMAAHGMNVTVLKAGTPEYAAFKKALEPLAKSQEAQYPAALVHDVTAQTK